MKEVCADVGELPAMQEKVVAVINTVMNVTHWSESVLEIVVELMCIYGLR